MTPREIADHFLYDVAEWYERKREPNGNINTNVMALGLIMVEHMAVSFPLVREGYETKKGGQVSLLGGARIKRVLAAHGETRKFTAEAGRTSRGTLDLAHQLADVLNNSAVAGDYGDASDASQESIRDAIQGWFVGRIRADYFDRQRIEVAEFDPRKPFRFAVAALLRAARERGGTTAGAVAQHLVGAKLSLRFPEFEISNESYTTADQQTDRPGDFLVGDTAFHVTMSPSENLMANRCTANVQHGFRPRVLVPEDRVTAARQMADNVGIGDQVAVSSIEEFVGTNMEEISGFAEARIRSSMRDLLLRYNERVRAVEPDPSLQIEIPGNLWPR